MDDGRIFTRNFVACCAVCFFLTLYFFMFFTGMTSYSEDRLGTDGTVAGIVTSAFILGDLAARLYSGNRVDRWGKRRTVVAGTLLAAAATVPYYLTESVPVLAAVRVIQGFMYGCAGTAVAASVVEGLPGHCRGRGIGYYSLSFTFASAIGPFLCISLMEDGSYEGVFAVSVAFAVAAAAASAFMDRGKEDFADQPGKARGISDFVEPGAIPLAMVAFLFFFSYSGILAFTSMYGEYLGLTEMAAFFFRTGSEASVTSITWEP